MHVRAETEKTTFSYKDDCTLTKPTGCWTYSTRDFEIPLCHIPPLRSFLTLDHKIKVKENEFYLLGPIFGPKIEDLSIEINQNFC